MNFKITVENPPFLPKLFTHHRNGFNETCGIIHDAFVSNVISGIIDISNELLVLCINSSTSQQELCDIHTLVAVREICVHQCSACCVSTRCTANSRYHKQVSKWLISLVAYSNSFQHFFIMNLLDVGHMNDIEVLKASKTETEVLYILLHTFSEKVRVFLNPAAYQALKNP